MLCMGEKPTYEELEKKITELKKESIIRNNIEEAFRESEEKYKLLLKNLPSIVYKGYKDWSVEFFDENKYLYHSSIAENLVFGTPNHPSFANNHLPQNEYFRKLLSLC